MENERKVRKFLFTFKGQVIKLIELLESTNKRTKERANHHHYHYHQHRTERGWRRRVVVKHAHKSSSG